MWHVIAAIVLFGLVVVFAVVLPALSAKISYSGPGVRGNLIALEVAKARWAENHTNSVWPTMQDIAPYFTNGWSPIRPVRQEIYIINKVGTPVISYDPRTKATSIVSTNDYFRILEEDKR